ncbi:hypothetical protein FRX31_013486 [Thalictrum thalictroides]|uniref:Uncharacterized protein n=1 Tax=Thalictrum thalictroides TaxID=46969 RepID=A0A7J6WJ56_THATH|nr:hypothetical protein FRX31_013486 [Thalictrum thalictroides]
MCGSGSGRKVYPSLSSLAISYQEGASQLQIDMHFVGRTLNTCFSSVSSQGKCGWRLGVDYH